MATQPNVLTTTRPTLADAFNIWKKQVGLELNCHHIGTIESFDALTQTATVSINYVKSFTSQNDVGTPSLVTKSYPNLQEVPCVFLGGGGQLGASLTFPVASGDECLLLFNDRDFDNWFMGSSNSSPNTGRTHAFSDAIALVGIRSLSNVIPNFDGSNASLNYGANAYKVGSDSAQTIVGANSIELTDTEQTTSVGTSSTTLDSTAFEISIGPAMDAKFLSTGKFSITNGTGEFVSALITALQTATAGGFPLLADLTVLSTFKV